jgi:hypothetical protein
MKTIGGHSYLLLEVLIALTLLTMCLELFIKIPSEVVRNEMFALKRLELQHISDNTFASVKEQIYTHKISWEQVSSKEKTLLFEDTVQLPLQEMNKDSKRQCYISSSCKKGQNNEEYRLVKIEVVLRQMPGKTGSLFYKKKKRVIRFPYQLFISS